MYKFTVFAFACVFIGVFGCGEAGKEREEYKNEQKNEQPPPPQPIPDSFPEQPPATVDGCSKVFSSASLGQEISETCAEMDSVSSTFSENNGYLLVSLKIYAQSAVFSYGSYLAYDPSVLRYESYQNEDFLGSNVNAFVSEMNSNEGAAGGVFYGCNEQPGKKALVVGASKSGYSTIGTSGNGTLMTLKFLILNRKTTELIFAENLISEKQYVGNTPVQKKVCQVGYIRLTF